MICISSNAARKVLQYTLEKTAKIGELSGMEVKAGLVARKVEGKKQLEMDGFLIQDLEDLL